MQLFFYLFVFAIIRQRRHLLSQQLKILSTRYSPLRHFAVLPRDETQTPSAGSDGVLFFCVRIRSTPNAFALPPLLSKISKFDFALDFAQF